MFQTQVNITPPPFSLSYQSSYLTVGSCFANTIGRQLERHKFDVQVNPFGIIFNPVTLISLLGHAIRNDFPMDNASLYGKNKDIHFHHLMHTDITALSSEGLQNNISQSLQVAKAQFEKADTIILTFGTAIVYEHLSGMIVANCHKVPSHNFKKRFLSTKEIIDAIEVLIPNLKEKRVILTVSPVRHAKEGLVENSTSKAILKYACHILQEQHANFYYFPAFEILVDELRDYRFYAEDMLHPSPQAQQIIWEKFRDHVFEEATLQTIFEVEKLLRSIEHRPFHPSSVNHREFLSQTLSKAKSLGQKIDLTKEIEILEERLKHF